MTPDAQKRRLLHRNPRIHNCVAKPILDIQNADFIDLENPSREGWLGYRSLVEGIRRGESDEE